LIVQVPNDAGDGILFVGLDRATLHARGVDTVVTGGRNRLLNRLVRRAPVQEAHAAPGLGFFVIQAVQAMAGGHARLAARAGVEIDLKGVLLTLARLC
jgi:hypothetical protein